MTRQEQNALIHKLQSLKGTPVWQNPPPGSMEQGLAVLRTHIGQASLPKLSFAQQLRTKLSFVQLLVPPQFSYTLAALALILSAVGAGAMSRKALPGESLYGAKLALEQTQVRLVSNPAARAQLQMNLAGKRLVEAEQVQAPEQKTHAIKRFSQEIKQAQATLNEAADPLQVEAATQALLEKAREYEEKLMKAKAQAGSQRQVGVAAVEEAEAALQDIHNPAL